MAQNAKCYKFHLLGTVGGTTPTVEELYYNWAVIHTALMLGTPAIRNFSRYTQHYLNPDVPQDIRLLRQHASTRFYIMGEHWLAEFDNVVGALTDPSHTQRMGRHKFGDVSKAQLFIGYGGPVYRSTGFQHPAAVSCTQWLVSKPSASIPSFVAQLWKHQEAVVSLLKEYGKPVKYTVDVCDEDTLSKLKNGALSVLPLSEYTAVELLQFQTRDDGFEFIQRHRKTLIESYATFADEARSHSVVGIERIAIDWSDDNPSTKMPLGRFFTDPDSLEYKMQVDDWNKPAQAFELLQGTKWKDHQTDIDRETPGSDHKTFTKEAFGADAE